MAYNEKSLKNLKPMWTSETAKEAQKKSVEVRKANAEAREQLKLTVNEWKKYKDEVLSDELSSIDILRILALKALESGDFDTAADLSKSLAEFEKPKLARVDQTTTDLTADELSDDELEKKLKELGIERNSDER